MDFFQYEQTHNMMQVWTGRQTARRPDWTIHRAAWSQLKRQKMERTANCNFLWGNISLRLCCCIDPHNFIARHWLFISYATNQHHVLREGHNVRHLRVMPNVLVMCWLNITMPLQKSHTAITKLLLLNFIRSCIMMEYCPLVYVIDHFGNTRMISYDL